MKQVVFYGSIGVGKTTAGNKIEEMYENITFLKEDLSENPFLPDFYSDMKKWGFHSSIAMLGLMSSYYKKFDYTKDLMILDNGVEELIAYTMLECDMGILNESEFFVYKKLYDNIVELLPSVDLYVYFICDSSVALDRIKKRNRDFEQDLNLDFLTKLNQKYEIFTNFLNKEKLLVVDTTNGLDYHQLVLLIEEKLKIKLRKK